MIEINTVQYDLSIEYGRKRLHTVLLLRLDFTVGRLGRRASALARESVTAETADCLTDRPRPSDDPSILS